MRLKPGPKARMLRPIVKHAKGWNNTEGLIMRKLILIGLMCLVFIPGYSPGTLPAHAGKAPAANRPAPQAAAQPVSPASHCQYCLSPFDKSFIFEEGNGSVTVTAPPGCAWTAATEDSFITITSGGSGSGKRYR